MALDVGHGGVSCEVESTRNADSELALRQQALGCIVACDSDGQGSGEAAKGGAASQGANFFEVLRVFVESEETVATEGWVACLGKVAVEDELDKGGDIVDVRADVGSGCVGISVGIGFRGLRAKGCTVAGGVDGVAERARCCSSLGLAEGGEHVIAVDAAEKSGLGAGTALRSGLRCFARGRGRRAQRDAAGQSWGKKRVGDPVNHAMVEFCNGKAGQDSLVGGAEVVVVCGSSGLRAKQGGIVEGGFFVVGDCAWIGLGRARAGGGPKASSQSSQSRP